MSLNPPDEPRLRLENICKSFGPLHANDHVSLEVHPGEVHCLLGENGAGKSTLMNIVYGLYQADAGQIWLDGRPVAIRSPKEAIAYGIGMVHQHFMLVPTLTVAENIILGARPLFAGSSLLIDMPAIEAQVAEIGRKYGLKINPSARIVELSVGEQQRVEIVKALYRGVTLLILDEPTAVLTPQETTELFDTLKTLTASGLSVIFITHKLNEVLAIGDQVTVLRDGRVAGQRVVGRITLQELADMMVGRAVKLTFDKPPAAPGETVLRLDRVTVQNHHGRALLSDLSLEVVRGEILGIAGVDGNGQRELALTIAGLLKPSAGRITLLGNDLAGKSPHQVMQAGVRHIPEDRQAMGLVLEFPVADNFILKSFEQPPFTRRGLLQPGAIAAHASRLAQAFDVRARTIFVKTGQLSGGNQQKIVVGREIDPNPLLLVAAQPTRGLDIGAIEYIHRLLLKQRAHGAAILLISTELEEILALSDRIAVMYEGRIVGELPGGRANVNKIGLMMAGVTQ